MVNIFSAILVGKTNYYVYEYRATYGAGIKTYLLRESSYLKMKHQRLEIVCIGKRYKNYVLLVKT